MTTEEIARGYRSAGWWPDEALGTRYTRIARTLPSHLAVADDRGTELSHQQLLAASRRMMARLAGAGVTSGDLVLSVMPNRVEWQVVFLALLQIGARPMTIPTTTDTATMTYLCDLTQARAIITSPRLGNTALGEMAVEAASKADRATAVLVVDDVNEVVVAVPAGWEPSESSVPLFDHVMTTSSTTGMPKAVMHTSNTLAALNVTFADRFALTAETPIFMGSPLGHSVGSIHGARLALYLGAPLILQERWDPDLALQLSARYRCEFTCAATPFLKDLIDAAPPTGQSKLHTMRTFLCGGAAVPPMLIDQADEHFPNTFVSVLWGMTEGGVTTCTPTSSREQRRNTAGCGMPGLELSIVGAERCHLPIGDEGELVMRGPGVLTGYLGQHQLYEECLTSDGFFRTGDLARLDAAGYVHLTGRLKDLIIRGGVNISPVPIEDVLSGHPGVRRVAVIGQPDDRLGERLCAVVVPAESYELTFESLVDWASAHGLTRRYWPESLKLVTEMPQTAAGKIRKNQLRDEIFGRTQ
ncbi:MAG: AMP-binding protein [Actinobacteria bacterium]|uniref:Unannotated protein n=1 Tax=freshwater metagenome TaxID=449393 RepID=A0A6J7M7Q7_9ZZZZ|nr:AMP-binding protein [Actinomycetota bacterium]MSW78891.1 AMP-binding protein [Actinomycetota bacterium]MSX54047.1 AMP-binding protein [Actinomycetota bacterium]MSZ84460.1 AMP-binding protein [Actinomycetota bacterium]MTB19426.1 AMP-binding protein [Actinomycetota bacterium]